MEKISLCFDIRLWNGFVSILFLHSRLKKALASKTKILLYVVRCDLFLTEVFSHNNSDGTVTKRKIQA